ncbi:SLBB domain-containing protein [Gammaproteobacteria bacterium]|nr:SLBB domain-containing protein [Gammaproteobacteria bacterium]MDB9842379.1 SLBB domain-containing protein [Gammaproteobacteria bacterium]
MKKISSYILMIVVTLTFFSPLNLSSQELDQDFIDSLPSDVAEKLTEDIQTQDDVEVLFRTDTSVSGNKAILKRIQQQIDSLKLLINPELDESLPRFGDDFFSSIQTSFSPINVPNANDDYVLDYGDELSIQLVGRFAGMDKYLIARDGSVSIDQIGKIFLRGLPLKEAIRAIESKISTTVIGTTPYISLSGYRDIQVLLLGDVATVGLYTLPGNTNILHALNVAGGISPNGSYRKIEHKRDGVTLGTFDLFDIMAFGNTFKNELIRAGDVIFVHPKSFDVILSGGVNREGRFEIVPGETISTAIKYAGGFSDSFFGLQHVNLQRLSNGKTTLSKVKLSSLDKIILQPRDILYLPFYDTEEVKVRQVKLSGMINSPGLYSIDEGESLSSLLRRAGGFKNTAYPFGGALFRISAQQLEKEFNERIYNDTINYIVSNPQEVGGASDSLSLLLEELKSRKPAGRIITEFNLSKIKNYPAKDIFLEDGDEIVIPPIPQYVYIFGEFNQPGIRTYDSKYSVKDYISQAGGFKNTSTEELIIIDPDGKTHFYKNTFLKPFGSQPDIYPGSILYVSRDIGRVEGIRFAATFAPILSSLAISLASLNSIND